jgi:hypothetical protein
MKASSIVIMIASAATAVCIFWLTQDIFIPGIVGVFCSAVVYNIESQGDNK